MIPYGKQDISQQDIDAVIAVLKSDFLTQGPMVPAFEESIIKYTGANHALAVNSATSALHVACLALEVGAEDIVWTSSISFVASANCAAYCGAEIDFVDIDPRTFNMCPKLLEIKLQKTKSEGKKLPKVVIPVHMCGQPCDMQKIMKIVKKNKLFLIEDCSHAHGSTYNNKKVGTFGDIGVFSLDNNKLLAAGEGGILVTDNLLLFEKALLVSDFGPRIFNQIKNRKLKKYIDTGLGFKHRIHPASAAIANCELKKINFYIKKRFQTLNSFSKKISKIPGISPPVTRNNCTRGAFFGYRIFFDKNFYNNVSVQHFVKLLQAEGMEIRKASNKPLQYLPLFHKQSGAKFLNKKFNNFRKFSDYDLPNSEYFYNNTLSLPTFTFEDKKLIESYIMAFKKVCNYLAK